MSFGKIFIDQNDSEEIFLKAKLSIKGGGPITGAVLYWATKVICYGTVTAAAGTVTAAAAGSAAVETAETVAGALGSCIPFLP